MTVTPVLERTFLLHVGEVMIHSNSVIRAIHRARSGRTGKTRNDVTMVEPTPAATSAAAPLESGGATVLSRSIFLPLSVGMIRGRLSGFEKKAKT